MEFREFFQGNPLVWQAATKDQNLPFEGLPELLKKWQDPHEADKLMKIEQELFEVKEIVHKNLTDLLKRGEELDSLMEKSKDLNTVSRDFYKKAKKQNQKCCNIT
jgi:synaptobrevin family protein YKT6